MLAEHEDASIPVLHLLHLKFAQAFHRHSSYRFKDTADVRQSPKLTLSKFAFGKIRS
jgi:hypothetical protein